jgi:hypothetical protein
MVESGVAALLEQLPAEVLAERSLQPADVAVAVYQAMSGEEWQPIATAPRIARNVLLGLVGPSGFQIGIGTWVDANDDSGGGNWSTESWWGKPPTHWRELPAPPPAAV